MDIKHHTISGNVNSVHRIIKLHKTVSSNYISTMSIMFNNNNKYIIEKLDAIIALIKKNMITIIHISNLNLDNFNYLDSKLNHSYDNVQVFKTENITYGSVLFLNRTQINFVKTADNPYYFDFENSNMERKIIGCEISYGTDAHKNVKLHILGIHLESGKDNDLLRLEQFGILSGIIKELSLTDYIVLGNYESNLTELSLNKLIKNNIGLNVWNELGCSMLTRGDNKEKIIYKTEKIYPLCYSSIGISPVALIPEPFCCYTGILCSFCIK